jgi:iron(III) transport system substrate-binding protein
MNARAGVAAICLLGGLLSACGSSGGSKSGQPTITLYNGQHPQTTQALVAAFEKQTGIHVRERDGDESELAQQILQEGKSSPADVMYAENSPALMSLEGEGLLASLPASLLSQVPSQYNSPNGDWLGVSARVSVIVYNPSRVSKDQLPASVLDLAQPQWKGKLALAPTETDFAPIVTAVAKAEGESAALTWLKGMKANGASHTYPDNESLLTAVNGGQAAIGVVDHYYWWRLQQEIGASSTHVQLAYFAPKDPGYVIDVSGAGVLASSKHQSEAQQLLAYLVSNAGQQVIVGSDSFEYPLHPGVAPRAGLTPFDQLQPYPVSVSDLGDGSVALKLLQQAQLL